MRKHHEGNFGKRQPLKRRRRRPWSCPALLCAILGCLLFLLALSNTKLADDLLRYGKDITIDLHHPQFDHEPREAGHGNGEDPRCLSRTQQPKLRKASRLLRVPPAFQREWDRYVELHQRCSRGKNWSHVFSQRPQERDLEGGDGACKYIVYLNGPEGIGNRLLSLASAWTYAVVSDRVLLIDTRRGLQELLCEPFPNSSWVLPQDFPYHEIDQSSNLDRLVWKKVNASSIFMNLRHTQGPAEAQMLCEGAHSALNKVPWLFWLSNLYMVPDLFLLPPFWRKWAPLMPRPDQSFALISRALIHPSNQVWALVLQEYRNYFMSADTNVGVQLRLLGHPLHPAIYDETAFAMVMECLTNSSYLPKVNYNSLAQATAWATQNDKEIMQSHRQADFGVLVVSLQGRYYKSMKELYGTNPGTALGKSVRVHSCTELQTEDRSFLQAQLALMEILLLSYSDHLATSAFSTFGYVAQSWGNILPLIFDFFEMANAPSARGSICTRASHSTDPCMHTPQIPCCIKGDGIAHALSKEHRQWLNEHLHLCQDHSSAWQLIQINPNPQPVFAFHS